MSDNLPPSKFGAGYTYGGGSAQPSAPAPSYSQPAAPPASPLPLLPPTPSYSTAEPMSPRVPAPPSMPVTAAAPTAYTAPVVGYQSSASGATAITAGVLALLLGAYRAWQTFSYFAALAMFADAFGELGEFKSILTIEAFTSLAATLALILGGILLLSRKTAGRGFIVAGCLIVIIDAVVTAGLYFDWFHSAVGRYSDPAFSSEAFVLATIAISAAVPVLTMVLALAGSTKRWCQAKSAAISYGLPTTYRP